MPASAIAAARRAAGTRAHQASSEAACIGVPTPPPERPSSRPPRGASPLARASPIEKGPSARWSGGNGTPTASRRRPRSSPPATVHSFRGPPGHRRVAPTRVASRGAPRAPPRRHPRAKHQAVFRLITASKCPSSAAIPPSGQGGQLLTWCGARPAGGTATISAPHPTAQNNRPASALRAQRRADRRPSPGRQPGPRTAVARADPGRVEQCLGCGRGCSSTKRRHWPPTPARAVPNL